MRPMEVPVESVRSRSPKSTRYTAPPNTPLPREGKYAATALVRPAARVAVWTANSRLSHSAKPAGFQNAASPVECDRGLPHSRGPRPHGKHEEQGTGVQRLVLGG